MRAHRTGEFFVEDVYGFKWRSNSYILEEPPRYSYEEVFYYCELLYYRDLWGTFNLNTGNIKLIRGNAFVYQYFTHGAIPESWENINL